MDNKNGFVILQIEATGTRAGSALIHLYAAQFSNGEMACSMTAAFNAVELIDDYKMKADAWVIEDMIQQGRQLDGTAIDRSSDDLHRRLTKVRAWLADRDDLPVWCNDAPKVKSVLDGMAETAGEDYFPIKALHDVETLAYLTSEHAPALARGPYAIPNFMKHLKALAAFIVRALAFVRQMDPGGIVRICITGPADVVTIPAIPSSHPHA